MTFLSSCILKEWGNEEIERNIDGAAGRMNMIIAQVSLRSGVVPAKPPHGNTIHSQVKHLSKDPERLGISISGSVENELSVKMEIEVSNVIGWLLIELAVKMIGTEIFRGGRRGCRVLYS